jgi:hypothetical protein
MANGSKKEMWLKSTLLLMAVYWRKCIKGDASTPKQRLPPL